MLNRLVEAVPYLAPGDFSEITTREQYELAVQVNCVEAVCGPTLQKQLILAKRQGGVILSSSVTAVMEEVLETADLDMRTSDYRNTHIPCLLRLHQTITIPYLRLKLAPTANKYKLLDLFLERERELQPLRYLLDALQWQALCQQRYGKSLTHAEARRLTVRDALDSITEPRLLHKWTKAWRGLWSCWNSARLFQDMYNECKRVELPELDEDPGAVTLSSTLSRSVGGDEGVLPRVLLNWCLTKHNEFLHSAWASAGAEASAARWPIQQLDMIQPSDLISYDLSLRFLIMHTAQSLSYGQGQQVEIDFVAAQQAVLDNVVAGKHLLHLYHLPEFEFIGEQPASVLLRSLPQQPIPRTLQAGQISEWTIEHMQRCREVVQEVMGFVAQTGADPQMLLSEYMHQTLSYTPEDVAIAALGGTSSPLYLQLRLCHLNSLLSLLTQQLDCPLEAVSIKYRQQLPEDIQDVLREALGHMDMPLLLSVWRQFVAAYFADYAEPYADTSTPLKEYLKWCADGDGNVSLYEKEWFDHFPASVQLGHLAHALEIAIACDE
ncbi:hypothetical protein CYMTET_14988 [Cymbomonas tetramitiformis]|uniref:Uncharacterized protein n=1 Tax=Cymbomonas tetramitiformis TaxID=36881 RepID=A0AAE0GFH0_9CHLO|nr:hypothetical protein CYMTET_14988 [Cymbomonas tetramitiformis]